MADGNTGRGREEDRPAQAVPPASSSSLEPQSQGRSKSAAARRKVAVNQMQDLLHEALIDTGHVQRCALVMLKDGSVRATSLGYQPCKKSIASIIRNFKQPPIRRLREIGFEGRLHTCMRNDSVSLYARDTDTGRSGFVATMTSTFIIYATYTSGMYASVCVEAVEKLGDYIREKGK
ncbi:profilin-4-like [Sycon ciliatum]|uniref:profilin-4-like n=1 Tax=Sycon ciliatum TaxID=27933 RepID=UPI0020AB2041|eukprot:scpid60653/ scgid19594/ Profilin-4; Profilin IV